MALKMCNVFIVFFIITFFQAILCDNQCSKTSSYEENVLVTTESYKVVKQDIEDFKKNYDAEIAKIRQNIETGAPPEWNYTIVYQLYTRKNPKVFYPLEETEESFRNSPFNNSEPVVFFVHGWIEKLAERYMTTSLKFDLLNRYDYNIIYVDYTPYTGHILSTAVRQSYMAANPIAKFIKYLLKVSGKKAEELHLISNSLGVHMASIVCRKIPGFGRHTALDPGSPMFELLPEDLLLQRDDAIFTDVLHTADQQPYPKGIGIYKPSGHLDFYPNGGLGQPGCNSTQPPEEMPRNLKEMRARVYAHVRAADLYMKSVCVRDCLFIGVLCDTYENFKKGVCTAQNSLTAIMGHEATKPEVELPEDAKFFLDTSDVAPYCIKDNQ